MKILVVDDDSDIRELVAFKLEQMGHEVLTEKDGEGGLAAAMSDQPDLILLDVMMPKLTGIEVVQKLRENDPPSRTPVILITAKAQEVDVERGFAAGANDYIVKPFSPRELASRVDAVLGRQS